MLEWRSDCCYDHLEQQEEDRAWIRERVKYAILALYNPIIFFKFFITTIPAFEHVEGKT